MLTGVVARFEHADALNLVRLAMGAGGAPSM